MNNKISIWKATAKESYFSTLDKNLSVDVVIIGGGITGITCAYLLSLSGKSVVVLESNKIGEVKWTQVIGHWKVEVKDLFSV